MSWVQTATKRGIDALLSPLGLEVQKKSNVRWKPILDREHDGIIPPRPLWVADNDTLFQFFRWSWEWYVYVTLLCGLRRDGTVLELGCSHGRTMLGLLDYLQTPGRYEGLDILAPQIEFARTKIQSRFPHFRFFLAKELYNSKYNPRGQIKAENFRFPYADGSFDVIYAASLFTHLIPPVAGNYLRESRRVLRGNGHCLFSFFLLDNYRGPHTPYATFCDFKESLAQFEDVAVQDARSPDMTIAYKSSLVEKLAWDAGLRIERVIPGSWSGAQQVAVSEQDLVLLEPS